MNLPIEVEKLPRVDQIVLEAILVEHKKSTGLMGRTLLSAGWAPEQIMHVEDSWSWVQLARAVAGERQKRGQSVVSPTALAAIEQAQPGAVAARAEAAWVEQHGEVAPPRPPIPGSPIRLPARPADVSGYALDPIEAATSVRPPSTP